MKGLLVFMPLAIALEFITPDRPILIFAAAAISIVRLAASALLHAPGPSMLVGGSTVVPG